MNWLVNNYEQILPLLVQHLRLSIPPIIIGFLLAIPLGWLAWRFRLTRGLLLTVAGLLYTIPSLALITIMPALFGLSYTGRGAETGLIIALSIYAVAIMARSAADAFGSVDVGVREAATAVGYSSWQRFWQVDLPLAGPVLLAGLRVVAVSTIALVTVGVITGVRSLGYFFTDGFQRQIVIEVLTGVVLTMVVALLVDGLLVLAGRAVLPWARGSAKVTRIAVGMPQDIGKVGTGVSA